MYRYRLYCHYLSILFIFISVNTWCNQSLVYSYHLPAELHELPGGQPQTSCGWGVLQAMTESHAPSRNVMFEGNHKRYSEIMHFANPIIIIKHAFVKKQNPLMGFPSPNLSKFQNVEPNLHSFLLGVHPPLRWQDLLRLRSELSSLDEKARHQTDPKLPPKNDARMKLTDDDLQIVQDILVLKGWSQVPLKLFGWQDGPQKGSRFFSFFIMFIALFQFLKKLASVLPPAFVHPSLKFLGMKPMYYVPVTKGFLAPMSNLWIQYGRYHVL